MGEWNVLADQVRVDTFTEFVGETEPRLRRALTAAFGSQSGRDACAEALVYAWKHWDRIGKMDNPAGYLYRVASNAAKKAKRSTIVSDFSPVVERLPWVEPGLGPALASLTEMQRAVVALVHAWEFSLSEAAELLEITKSTVQTHEQRGMATLRRKLGANR